MEKSFEETLRRRFEHSLSAISIKAVERMEMDVEVDGRKRSAEYFEAVIKGDIIRLYVRIVRVHKTFFKGEEVFATYEMDRGPCPSFSLKKVLSMIRDAGYAVPSALFEKERENYAVERTLVHRDDSGVNRFFSSLRTFGIESLRLTLNYDSEGEGFFSLSLLLKAPEAVDTGNLRHLDLGIHDYAGEVSRDKREAIIKYLRLLSTFSMHAGLEIFNIVDYMSIIEVMQEKGRDEDYSFSIEKHRSSFSLSHPNYGGESYADYGLSLTPLDFAWYMNGFTDTDNQRAVFFSYYDVHAERSEKGEDEYYLEVLGLKKGARLEDVQKAYKNIVQRFHPDKISSLGLDPAFIDFANCQMQRANEAYENLKRILTS